MGILTEDMRQVVEAQLGFIATVCPDGTPNLSPKGTTAVWDDDHLVFADIRSPGTVANLRSNPSIEVNVVDQLIRKGYRFKGTAVVHTDGELFERGIRFYEARGTAKARERIRGIVLVRVERALAESNWDARLAVLMLARAVDTERARAMLSSAEGSLASALA